MSARLSHSGLEPWQLPSSATFYPEPDLFASVEEEEAILSFAIANPGRVKSLKPEHFTGRDRPRIYSALLAGKSYQEIEQMGDLDLPGYVAELFLHTGSSGRQLKEMIANVKRLASLRALRDDVAAWMRKANGMSVRGAQVALALVCRASAVRERSA